MFLKTVSERQDEDGRNECGITKSDASTASNIENAAEVSEDGTIQETSIPKSLLFRKGLGTLLDLNKVPFSKNLQMT